VESQPLLHGRSGLVWEELADVCLALESVVRSLRPDAKEVSRWAEREVLDAEFRLLVDGSEPAVQLDEEPRPLEGVLLAASRLNKRTVRSTGFKKQRIRLYLDEGDVAQLAAVAER